MEGALASVPVLCDILPLPSMGLLAATRRWGEATQRALRQGQRDHLHQKLLSPLETALSLMRLFPRETMHWGDMMAKGQFLFVDDESARARSGFVEEGVWCLPLSIAPLAAEATSEGRLRVLWSMLRRQGHPRRRLARWWPKFDHPPGKELDREFLAMRERMRRAAYLIHLHRIAGEMEATRCRPRMRSAMEAYTCVYYLLYDHTKLLGEESVHFLYNHYLPHLIGSLLRGGRVEKSLKSAICSQIFRLVGTRYLVHYERPSLEHVWREAEGGARRATC